MYIHQIEIKATTFPAAWAIAWYLEQNYPETRVETLSVSTTVIATIRSRTALNDALMMDLRVLRGLGLDLTVASFNRTIEGVAS